MSAFVACPERSLSENKDLDVMNKAISALVEATEENILTEAESNALLQFLVSKFVERRFCVTLNRVFEPEARGEYSFRGIRGTLK